MIEINSAFMWTIYNALYKEPEGIITVSLFIDNLTTTVYFCSSVSKQVRKIRKLICYTVNSHNDVLLIFIKNKKLFFFYNIFYENTKDKKCLPC